MVRLVIDEQQAQTLAKAEGVVEVANPTGRVIGHVRFEPVDSGFTEEEIRVALEGMRTTTRWWTTREALDRVEKLTQVKH